VTASAPAPLLQSLPQAWQALPAGDLPAWFRERQQRALEAARTAPWPARGMEAWKYTSLQRTAAAPLRIAPTGAHAEPEEGGDAPGLVFRNGHVTQASGGIAAGIELQPLSRLLREDPEAVRFVIARETDDGDVLDRLNTAFARDGAWLRAGAGASEARWITLRSGSARGASAHLAHRIDVGEGARLRVRVELDGYDDAPETSADDNAPAPALATLLTRVRVQRGGRLELAWIAPAGVDARIMRTRIELEHGAELVMTVLDAGASPSRHDLRVSLRGERAMANIGGAFLLRDAAHADLQLDLRHEARNTRSQTTWRAIAGDRGRAVFNGQITVAHGADGTDAQLGCKSLALSPQAEIDAKPVLEIYTDDVKCAHGATVGQIDEQALFYLRTRGLPEDAARALLLRAFAQEAFVDAGNSPVSEALSALSGEAA
jgi:Fe-S cluster assembly protein SufD